MFTLQDEVLAEPLKERHTTTVNLLVYLAISRIYLEYFSFSGRLKNVPHSPTRSFLSFGVVGSFGSFILVRCPNHVLAFT